jgi:anaerobic selenocysteine-containing dehydrogenase
MTNHWVDIKNANLVVVMGGNAAEAHPVGSAGRWKPKSITARS